MQGSSEFREALRTWRDHKDSKGGGMVTVDAKLPKCKTCGRVEAQSEKWSDIHKKLEGEGQGVLGGLEEEMKGVMEEWKGR